MNLYPEIPDLLNLVETEVDRLGGTVSDRFRDSERLFVRALLPVGREVQRRDFIGHGLAVRTRDRQVVVHPYTFRQVCSNGAIHIDHIASRCVERTEFVFGSRGVNAELRRAIEACSTPAVFDANLDDMQRMLAAEVRMPIAMARLLSWLGDSDLVMQIMDGYLEGRDRSLFGLMNAVTSRARDEPKPETRWNLEELGGGILAVLRPPKPLRTPGRQKRFPARLKRPASKAG